MAASDLNEKTLKELLRLGQLTGDPKGKGMAQYAVVPNDCRIEDVTKYAYNQYAERPHRIIGTVRVLDAQSFVTYYTDFADEHSRVFADETQSAVLGVLDYHASGDGNTPRWCQHRAQLNLQYSPEWLVWVGANGRGHAMNQGDFAEFIENNTPDMVEPKAADMLEMARTLAVKSDANFESAIRLSNGQTQFAYNETVRGTFGSGKLEIPEEFVISIPVYIGTARATIRARLRYRLAGGKLSIWYDLLRHEAIKREAFTRVLGQIQEGLKAAIINGTPDP